ncbi:MAG: putative minor tail protein [Prokaryotic dsDNA virus sp.]|nr:MAG: putative minor tail protein [Prokaryotic dsDNA virus sp.]
MATNKQIIEFQGKGIAKLKTQYAELEKRTRGLEGATNRSSKSLGGMIAALGLTTGALFGTMRAMSAVVSVGRNFEKQISNLSAITGATGEELKALERNARQLGSTTVFTASEVAALSVEFGKLGFTSKEIQGVTKDTLALAAASGTDLAQSAMVAGQTLRAFGLDVSETSRVTDTMAASFSSSALDMEKFTFSMQFVAPIARQVGIDIEATTGMLGTLANAGIDGSLAGTALRTILLKLGDENSKLTKKIGFSVKSSDDLQKAFKKLSEMGMGSTEMLELVDKRAVSAFGVLLNGVDTTATLADSFEKAGGKAQEMAETQLDNLDGSLTLLNSAMEGLGLRMFEFVDGPLRSMVDDITSLTNTIDEEALESFANYAMGIGAVTTAVIAYNTAVTIASVKTKVLQAALIKTGYGAAIVGAGLLLGKILELTGAFEDEAEAINKANTALDSHSNKTNVGTQESSEFADSVNFMTRMGFDQSEILQHLNEQYSIQSGEIRKVSEDNNSLLSSIKPISEEAIKENNARIEAGKLKKQQLMDDLKNAALQQTSAKNAVKAVVRAESMEAVAGFISSIFKSVPYPFNLALAAAGGATVAGVIDKGLSSFATGGQFVTDGPQMIQVGDNPSGRELVEITPLGGDPNINGPQGRGITLNISAPLVDETVIDAIIPAIERASRMNLA